MKTIKLSATTVKAAKKFEELYEAGGVFVKDTPEIHATCEVFLAGKALADLLGKDLAKHLKDDYAASTKYEILYNMKFLLRRRLSKNRCAVGIYDFEERSCKYAGIVSC